MSKFTTNGKQPHRHMSERKAKLLIRKADSADQQAQHDPEDAKWQQKDEIDQAEPVKNGDAKAKTNGTHKSSDLSKPKYRVPRKESEEDEIAQPEPIEKDGAEPIRVPKVRLSIFEKTLSPKQKWEKRKKEREERDRVHAEAEPILGKSGMRSMMEMLIRDPAVLSMIQEELTSPRLETMEDYSQRYTLVKVLDFFKRNRLLPSREELRAAIYNDVKHVPHVLTERELKHVRKLIESAYSRPEGENSASTLRLAKRFLREAELSVMKAKNDSDQNVTPTNDIEKHLMRLKTIEALGQEEEDTRASAVQERKIEWIIHNLVADGTITVVCGPAGLGKSYMSYDLSARLSRGIADPPSNDHIHVVRKPVNTLLIDAEDSPDTAWKPRLKAHGADMDRVYRLPRFFDEQGNVRGMRLPEDVSKLETFVATHAIRFISINPLNSFLGGVNNSFKNTDMRDALLPLLDMAQRQRCGLLIYGHPNKNSSEKDSLYRMSGSSAVVEMARAVFIYGIHPRDPDSRVLACRKWNFDTESKPVALQAHKKGGKMLGRLIWAEENGVTADELLTISSGTPGRPANERQKAERFLKTFLGTTPQWSATVMQAAFAAGISEKTLRRAMKGIVVSRPKDKKHFWELSAEYCPSENRQPVQ